MSESDNRQRQVKRRRVGRIKKRKATEFIRTQFLFPKGHKRPARGSKV